MRIGNIFHFNIIIKLQNYNRVFFLYESYLSFVATCTSVLLHLPLDKYDMVRIRLWYNNRHESGLLNILRP